MNKRKLRNLEVNPIGVGCMGFSHGYGEIPSEEYSIQAIQKAQAVHPLSAIQNIYSMVERSCEEEVIPYCMEHNIALVPFSPIASGLLSGKVNTSTDFSHNDDVRKFVPQLKKENLEANQPLIQLIETYAKAKNATDAQIALAWMLHKYPNVVPIPGSKNQERILENLAAWDVILTDAYIANGSAAWRLPDLNTYPSICPPYVKPGMADSWTPFQRDPQTGAPPRCRPHRGLWQWLQWSFPA